MKLSSTDLVGLERAGIDMFRPIARRQEEGWTAIVSAVPNRRANAIYPLSAPPSRLDRLVSLLALHGRRIRCKVPDWCRSDVRSALTDMQLHPVYGAEVMARPVGRHRHDERVTLSEAVDDQWIRVHGDISPRARTSYGAEGSQLRAARLEDAAVGLMVVSGAWAGITAMYTQPGRRGQGLARAILATLLAEAEHLRVSAAFLQVVASNESAIGLYTSMGFERLGSYDYWQ